MTPRAARPLPDRLQLLLEECRPQYALLRRHALRPLGSSVPRPPGGGAGEPQAQQAQAQAQQQAAAEPQQQAAAEPQQQAAAEPQATQCGSLAYLEDPRNDDVLVGMRDGVSGERGAAHRWSKDAACRDLPRLHSDLPALIALS